jgi:DNA ligase (NAD+)
MTNIADRTRGNNVSLNGTISQNAGAFAEETYSAPEAGSLLAPATASPLSTTHEYSAAVASALEAATAYYGSDVETMADSDYDKLLDRIAVYEAANGTSASGGLFTDVAAGTLSTGDVAHDVPMLSLDKAKTTPEVRAFLEKAREAGSPVRVEPKLDGMAIDAKYVDGTLVVVATRGDGRSGENITDRVKALAPANLPTSVPFDGTVHIRGELVMSNDDFALSNANRQASGEKAFANPRNAVAGSVRASNLGYKVAVSFVSYGIDGAPDDADALEAAGFNPSSKLIPGGYSDIVGEIEAFGVDRKNGFPYPTDGVVLKMTDPAAQAALGETDRHPRHAIAYKYEAESAITKLIGIETAFGRTGAISFTALLEPVQVDGSVVGRATLNNVDFIRNNDLRIGDRVEVDKANDIIPRVVRSFPEHRSADSKPYEPPTTSPSGAPLDMSGAIWRSTDPEDSLGALVTYATSRDVLDIDGLGEEISDALVNSGTVNDIGDLFLLSVNDIASQKLSGNREVGQKTAEKIHANIQEAKNRDLNRILTSLGIRKFGRTFGRRVAKKFNTMDAILDAPRGDFYLVEGVGDERADLFYQGFTKNRPVIEKMRAAGVNMGSVPAPAAASGPKALAGMKVVVTGAMSGALASMNRNQVQELIESNGGAASGSVSGSTSLLVCGEEGSSKFVKAQALGVKIVTPEQFAAMLGL